MSDSSASSLLCSSAFTTATSRPDSPFPFDFGISVDHQGVSSAASSVFSSMSSSSIALSSSSSSSSFSSSSSSSSQRPQFPQHAQHQLRYSGSSPLSHATPPYTCSSSSIDSFYSSFSSSSSLNFPLASSSSSHQPLPPRPSSFKEGWNVSQACSSSPPPFFPPPINPSNPSSSSYPYSQEFGGSRKSGSNGVTALPSNYSYNKAPPSESGDSTPCCNKNVAGTVFITMAFGAVGISVGIAFCVFLVKRYAQLDALWKQAGIVIGTGGVGAVIGLGTGYCVCGTKKADHVEYDLPPNPSSLQKTIPVVGRSISFDDVNAHYNTLVMNFDS